MLYIEGYWETADSLEDIVKIIREHYNHELADRMNELLEPTRISNDELKRLDELETVVQQIRDLVF